MKLLFTIVIAATLLFARATNSCASMISTFPAFAATTADYVIDYPYSLGQTFVATPGTTALTSFTYYVTTPPDIDRLLLEIYEWTNPSFSTSFGPKLFEGQPTVTPYDDPVGHGRDYFKVTLDTGNIALTPGVGYVASLTNQDGVAFAAVGADLYPRGTIWAFKQGGILLWKFGHDAAFTATFVGGQDLIYARVPEPIGCSMLLVGSICSALCRRRRPPPLDTAATKFIR
jgi:hypothetical protein